MYYGEGVFIYLFMTISTFGLKYSLVYLIFE